MAQPRAKTSRQSSPAGDTTVLDEPNDGLQEDGDEDPCGHGCHAEGVPPNAVSIGCEHGTYPVTPGMRRKAAFVSRPPENVHDRSVHFAAEEAGPAPDAGALKELVDLVNGLSARVLKLEGQVRELGGAVQQLVEPITGE